MYYYTNTLKLLIMIIAENVHFSYSRKKPLFKDLNLSLKKNKIYGLLGRNGMGKSTLMKLLAGFLPAKEGKLKVGAYNPIHRETRFMENIFFLNEDFDLPAISLSNYEKAYSGFYPKFDQEKFHAILTEFEVPRDQKLTKLSYGQKKKIIIAFGIATNVDYVFLDEPTNGLDIPSKSQFRKLLAKNFSENQSIIISTHQIRDLANLLDSIIIIDNGEIQLSMDLGQIEDKLLFATYKLDDQSPIYSEMHAGGSIHIYPNLEKCDSQIEIETFFNAFIAQPQIILNTLNA